MDLPNGESVRVVRSSTGRGAFEGVARTVEPGRRRVALPLRRNLPCKQLDPEVLDAARARILQSTKNNTWSTA